MLYKKKEKFKEAASDFFSVQSWNCLEKKGGVHRRGGGEGGGVRFGVLHKGKAQH